jgi:hypothetical protein
MRFPTIVLLAGCGGFLVTGGVLLDSNVTLAIGLLLWAIGALMLLHSAVRFAVDVWSDWRFKKYMRALRKRSLTPESSYSPRAGLR